MRRSERRRSRPPPSRRVPRQRPAHGQACQEGDLGLTPGSLQELRGLRRLCGCVIFVLPFDWCLTAELGLPLSCCAKANFGLTDRAATCLLDKRRMKVRSIAVAVSTMPIPVTFAARLLCSASAVLLPLRAPQSAHRRASCRASKVLLSTTLQNIMLRTKIVCAPVRSAPVLHELFTTPLHALRMACTVVNIPLAGTRINVASDCEDMRPAQQAIIRS